MPSGWRPICILLALAAIAAAPAAASTATPHGRTTAGDVALGHRLVTRFWTLTRSQDRVGLSAFLSPAFQAQRTDGTGATKSAYIASIGTTLVVADFRLSSFKVTRTGRFMVARFDAATSHVVGSVLYSTAPTPRMETFAYDGRRWLITSNANFLLPDAVPVPGVATGRVPLI